MVFVPGPCNEPTHSQMGAWIAADFDTKAKLVRELAEQKLNVSQANLKIQALERVVFGRDVALKQHQQMIYRLQGAITLQERKYQQQLANTVLNGKQEELKEKEIKVNKMEKELGEKEKFLVEKGKELHDREKTLVEKERGLLEKEKGLFEKEKELLEKGQKLVGRERLMERLENQHIEREKVLREGEKQVEASQRLWRQIRDTMAGSGINGVSNGKTTDGDGEGDGEGAGEDWDGSANAELSDQKDKSRNGEHLLLVFAFEGRKP